MPVLAIVLLGADEFEVGLLGAAGTLAFLLVGLPAGAWIDRARKRPIMMRANAVRVLAFATIPLLWWAGVLEVWHLIAFAAVVGVATVFFDIAYQSYIPVLVPRERIADANGKLESTAQLAGVGGPALGGLLLTIVQAPVLLAATALTYLTSFAMLATVRDVEVARPRDERRPLRIEIAEGLRFVFGNRLLRAITLCTASTNFFATLGLTMLPLLVLRDLGLGPEIFGIATAVGAIGGIVGAVVAARVTALIGEGTVIPVAALLGVIALVPIVVMPLAPAAAVPLLMLGQALGAISVLVYNIAQVSFRQRICPVPLLGRMNASIRFVVWGVMPIAGVLSGVLAGALGIAATLQIALVGMLLGSGFVVLSPLLRMRRLPDSADEHAARLSPDSEQNR
jgi:MFS family permease